MNQTVLRLGDRLDNVDHALASVWASDTGLYPPGVTNAEYDGLLHKRHEAASIYSRALWQRVIAARDKFRNRVQPPRARDAIALREEMYDAEIHLDLLEKLGFDFSTERERIDAHARAWLARERYEIAEEKFQDHQRQARADRRAGIVRT